MLPAFLQLPTENYFPVAIILAADPVKVWRNSVVRNSRRGGGSGKPKINVTALARSRGESGLDAEVLTVIRNVNPEERQKCTPGESAA